MDRAYELARYPFIESDLLLRQASMAGLAAYGGWNTAGNTLGTVLAQAMIRVIALKNGATREQRAAQLEFLFLRFLDDAGYQVCERTRCMVEDLHELGLAPTVERLPEDMAAEIERRLGKNLGRSAAALRDLFIRSGLVRDVRVGHVHLPWRRLFEVAFDVRVDLE
jgi:hypothetical protein